VGVRITSWNILHGMAIPPRNSPDLAAELAAAVQSLNADVMGFQEVDHFLPRSNSRPQIRDIAESVGARDWAMGPSVIGTPGESWRKLHEHEPELITDKSSHAELMHECYGIGIVSKIPVISWHRLNLGRSFLGLPLIVPGDESGKGKPRFIYVKDEPRLAIAAVLENGWTVVNTHLSFVPGLNLRQLRRLKKWAVEIAEASGTRALVMGDLNLPKDLPTVFSPWKSLAPGNTYPSWKPSIKFDYLLSPDLHPGEFSVMRLSPTGISDHLPLGLELSN
jgi:endonuclease/exonuclease/phosphatase family metal-dependent hydrolase